MASGDIFRTLDSESELGRKFRQYSSQGLHVPNEVTIEVWYDYVQRQIATGGYRPQRDLLVLDGIPRSVEQCKSLDPHLDVLRVIHLSAPDIDEMVERLKKRAEKENRTDDADEAVIRRRFKVYENETSPVLDHYDSKLVREVPAVGAPGR